MPLLRPSARGRGRAATEPTRSARALLLTVNGIAAGLRTPAEVRLRAEGRGPRARALSQKLSSAQAPPMISAPDTPVLTAVLRIRRPPAITSEASSSAPPSGTHAYRTPGPRSEC